MSTMERENPFHDLMKQEDLDDLYELVSSIDQETWKRMRKYHKKTLNDNRQVSWCPGGGGVLPILYKAPRVCQHLESFTLVEIFTLPEILRRKSRLVSLKLHNLPRNSQVL